MAVLMMKVNCSAGLYVRLACDLPPKNESVKTCHWSTTCCDLKLYSTIGFGASCTPDVKPSTTSLQDFTSDRSMARQQLQMYSVRYGLKATTGESRTTMTPPYKHIVSFICIYNFAPAMRSERCCNLSTACNNCIEPLYQ
eukprot:GHRQ01020937.1.p1 GENE.GHRQ01020937.1~~GHRQ01020937.1.p1  ORF type:complete len:140 (-),score=8.38 GHRQ01020937.1:1111-1530(-)